MLFNLFFCFVVVLGKLVHPQDIIPHGAKVNHYDWNITVETRNIDGSYRPVFLINGQSPGPTVEGDQGDWVVVKVHNYLTVPVTLHWHGLHQKDTQWADGAPGITQYPILSGDSYTYVYKLDQYGFYWYHAHFRGYSNDGLVGGIYIRPGDGVTRPYEELTSDPETLSLFYELEKKPQELLFSDFFKDTYDEVASKMFDFGMDPTCVRTFLTNGKGRHVCMDNTTRYNDANKKVAKLTGILEGAGAPVPDQITVDSYGCLDLNALNGFTSITYDKSLLEFPGYNTDCVNATTDRDIIYTNNQSYIMLNVLNMGGEFSKMFSIDDHNITVVAVDGEFIKPVTGQQVYLPIGQRVTAIVETNQCKHADISQPFAIRTACNDMPQLIEGLSYLVYGTANSTNSTIIQEAEATNGVKFQGTNGELTNTTTYALASIDPRIQAPYNASLVPPSGPADVTIYLYLNRLGQTTFTVRNNVTMSGGMELDKPALYEIATDKSRSVNLTEVMSEVLIDEGIQSGDVVDIIFQNSALADHPMHFHGHTFWVIGMNDSISTFEYDTVGDALNDGREDLFNFQTAPYVDNLSVLTGGYGITRFVADNPGVWMIHCHIQTHLSAGMGAAFVEAKEDIPNLPTLLLKQNHAHYSSMKDLVPSQLNVTLV